MDIIDIGLWLGYLLFIVAIGSAIVLPLLHAIKTPGAFLRSLYGVGALVLIFVVSYAISSLSSDVTQAQAALGVTESSSTMIGAGLIMFYITLVVAVIGIVYSEISKAFK